MSTPSSAAANTRRCHPARHRCQGLAPPYAARALESGTARAHVPAPHACPRPPRSPPLACGGEDLPDGSEAATLCAGGRNPMCLRLQPYVLEAATLSAGGRNPICWRPQPYLLEAATPRACGGQDPSRLRSFWRKRKQRHYLREADQLMTVGHIALSQERPPAALPPC